MGFRTPRDEGYGVIYDFFAIDFQYPKGVHVLSMCRQISNCANGVNEFLTGGGRITQTWHAKYSTLLGFYRYAISRGYVATSPLPTRVPQRPPQFVPRSILIFYIEPDRSDYDRSALNKPIEQAYSQPLLSEKSFQVIQPDHNASWVQPPLVPMERGPTRIRPVGPGTP